MLTAIAPTTTANNIIGHRSGQICDNPLPFSSTPRQILNV